MENEEESKNSPAQPEKNLEAKMGDALVEFCKKIAFPAGEEFGMYLSDSVRFWRVKKQIRILQRAKEYVEKKNVSLKVIQLKTLVPLLDHASLEEEVYLEDKWVALLVNYMDSSKNFKNNVFPFILSQISTEEAKALEFLKNSRKPVEDCEMPMNIEGAEIANLIRLGLVHEIPEPIKGIRDKGPDNGSPEPLRQKYFYQLTDLGLQFLDCCTLN